MVIYVWEEEKYGEKEAEILIILFTYNENVWEYKLKEAEIASHHSEVKNTIWMEHT